MAGFYDMTVLHLSAPSLMSLLEVFVRNFSQGVFEHAWSVKRNWTERK